MSIAKGRIVLMGSGELTATMVEVHKEYDVVIIGGGSAELMAVRQVPIIMG